MIEKKISGLKRYFERNGARFLLIFLVFYTFIMLGRSVWTNFELSKQMDSMGSKIAQTKNQNNNLENLILYYKSDSFREVEARSKLGLKKPNEKILTVQVSKIENFNQEIQSQVDNISTKKTEERSSNPSLWWQYLTK